MTNTEETTAETKINNWASKYGIEATFEFVPFSKSRNSGEKYPSLNWKVTLYKDKLPECAVFSGEIMRFDYMQGCGHAPSYKQNVKYRHEQNAIKFECEKGKRALYMRSMDIHTAGKSIDPPKLAEVLYSIGMDVEAIEYGTFEDWAGSMGYESDSRKAESIYKTCLEYGLKLRSAVGDKGLTELRDASQDY